MEAKAIIKNKFDDIKYKNFDELDIVNELEIVPESDRGIFENISEWLAFRLVEGINNEWGSYYGPYLVCVDGTCVPSKEAITSDVLDYWEKRVDEVSNPILKARYSGLLVDFKHKCDGKIREVHIQSIVDIIKGNYPKYSMNCVNKLQRVFQLAIESKNQKVIAEVKQIILWYDEMAIKDNEAGVWGRIFMIMIDNYSHFTHQERTKYVDQLEDRLERLISKDIDAKGNDRFDYFVVEDAVRLLARYYNNVNDRCNLKRVLDTLYNSYHKLYELSAIQKQMQLDRLYRIFVEYQYKEDAKKILSELQTLNKDVLNEMSVTEIPFEISRELLDEYVGDMTFGSKEEVFSRFITQFVPNKEESKKKLLEITEKSPLLALCPTQLYDYKGRPGSKIGSVENDMEGRLVSHISDSMRYNSILVHYVIEENINKGNFSKESILEFLKNSPLFESDRFGIIEKGVDAYMDNDYLTMLHLLVPQIENAIRNLVELSGKSTLEPQRLNSGFQLRTFDNLLRDETILNIGEDFAYYLRVLFTDQRGWNLRNSICHGLFSSDFFNAVTADRVFHALICVSSIKIQQDGVDIKTMVTLCSD